MGAGCGSRGGRVRGVRDVQRMARVGTVRRTRSAWCRTVHGMVQNGRVGCECARLVCPGPRVNVAIALHLLHTGERHTVPKRRARQGWCSDALQHRFR